VVRLARARKVTRGRQRRIDGPVGRTHSQHPTDRTGLDDGVGVRSRLVVNATQALHEATVLARSALRERPRSATRQLKRLRQAARQPGAQVAARMRPAYQRRLTLTTPRGKQAARVGSGRLAQSTALGRTRATARHRFVPWVPPVKPPTTRRLLPGEAVPAPEKVVRRFAPHPASSRPGQPGRPTAFGRGRWRDAVEGGSLRRDAVLAGHPAADAPRLPRMAPHRRVFQRPPRRLAGERGRHSTAHARSAPRHGVAPGVWPTPGAQSATRMGHAPPRWCRHGHH
jgi:IS5 family transposase